MRIRQEEERNYKNAVDKGKDDPKLFYRSVDGKLKYRQGITKFKVEANCMKTHTYKQK